MLNTNMDRELSSEQESLKNFQPHLTNQSQNDFIVGGLPNLQAVIFFSFIFC